MKRRTLHEFLHKDPVGRRLSEGVRKPLPVTADQALLPIHGQLGFLCDKVNDVDPRTFFISSGLLSSFEDTDLPSGLCIDDMCFPFDVFMLNYRASYVNTPDDIHDFWLLVMKESDGIFFMGLGDDINYAGGELHQIDEGLALKLFDGVDDGHMLVAMVLVLQHTLLYLNSKNNEQTEITRKVVTGKGRKRRRIDEPTGDILVGRGVQHHASMRSKGSAINKRFIVRGHWRRQPYGKGRTQYRMIRIAPHYKGPEDAVMCKKDYRVVGK